MTSAYLQCTLRLPGASLPNPSLEPRISFSVLHFPIRKPRVSRFFVAAQLNGVLAESGMGKSGAVHSSVGVNPNQLVPPPKSKMGSPLLWFGVGVALNVLFSVAVSSSENYAKKVACNTMMLGYALISEVGACFEQAKVLALLTKVVTSHEKKKPAA